MKSGSQDPDFIFLFYALGDHVSLHFRFLTAFTGSYQSTETAAMQSAVKDWSRDKGASFKNEWIGL